MLMCWETAELIRQRTGLRLGSTKHTYHLTLGVDETRGTMSVLYGPYFDGDDPETTVLVVWNKTGDHSSMQLLVQDCEGDFLNSNAQGAEKYDVGVIRIG